MFTALVLSLALATPPLDYFSSGVWKVRLHSRRVPRAERGYEVVFTPHQPGEPGLSGSLWDDGPIVSASSGAFLSGPVGRRFTLVTQGDGFCHVLVGRVTRRGLRGRGRRYDATCTVPQRPRVIQWEARR